MSALFVVRVTRPSGPSTIASAHLTREAAEAVAARLAKLGLHAQVGMVAEQPEHRNDRRRFLIWCLMVGAVKPDVVTTRIVDEIERETAP